jgi:hypothetical protein
MGPGPDLVGRGSRTTQDMPSVYRELVVEMCCWAGKSAEPLVAPNHLALLTLPGRSGASPHQNYSPAATNSPAGGASIWNCSGFGLGPLTWVLPQ